MDSKDQTTQSVNNKKHWSWWVVIGVIGTIISVIACLPAFMTNTISAFVFTTNLTGNYYCQVMAVCYASDGMTAMYSLSFGLFLTISGLAILNSCMAIDKMSIMKAALSEQMPSKKNLYANLLTPKWTIIITTLILFVVANAALYNAIFHDIARINTNMIVLSENPRNDIEIRRLKSLIVKMTKIEDYRYIRSKIAELKQSEDSHIEPEHQIIENTDDGNRPQEIMKQEPVSPSDEETKDSIPCTCEKPAEPI